MNRLPAHRFTFEKSVLKVGFTPSQIFSDPYRNSTKLRPEVTVIGFCDAKDLAFRNREEGFAIMAELDGEEFWFHNNALPSTEV